jgi:TRAP-type C4-dicarboxylate transport system substrate-binding protein
LNKRILWLTLLIVLAVIVIFGGCAAPAPATKPGPAPTPTPAPAAKVYEWKLQSFNPPAMERYQIDIATQLVKMISEYTEGRIKITPYAAGALVPVPDQVTAMRDNVIQMSHYVGSYVAGVIPVANVEFSMPLAYQTTDDSWTVMWYRGMQDLLQKAYNEKGVYYLGFQTPMGNRLMTTKPIRTFNDFKGLKVRAIGTFATFAEKLGMSPVNIPMTEQYMALKLGTIEGAITGFDVHFDSKHQEICKFVTLPKFSFAEPLSILVSLKEWNALPGDLKNILTLVLRDWSHWGGMIIEPPRIKKVEDGMKAVGVEFVQLPAEDVLKVQAAAVEVWDEWAKKDDYSAKAVAILKAYAKEMGRIK